MSTIHSITISCCAPSYPLPCIPFPFQSLTCLYSVLLSPPPPPLSLSLSRFPPPPPPPLSSLKHIHTLLFWLISVKRSLRVEICWRDSLPSRKTLLTLIRCQNIHLRKFMMCSEWELVTDSILMTSLGHTDDLLVTNVCSVHGDFHNLMI